jgi:uncharacterized protein (DUF433 family)
METILSINLIATNPNVRGGRPIIAGTRISVSDVVIAVKFHQQSSEEVITNDYPHLTLAQVHAALAYYYEHPAAIDAEIADTERQTQELKDKRVGSRHQPLSG